MQNKLFNRTFRLFVSSTFSDFTVERKILQEEVFPEIKEYCTKKSLTFLPIDLRWGVSNEAQLNQRTLELCLDEVKTSKLNPYPNFLIMAGDRYGWIPLPYDIEKDEYENILKNIKEDNDKNFLNSWYILDSNQIPASYILNERKDEYEDFSTWEKVENSLRDILQKAVNNSSLTEEQKEKYFTSATEQEVKEGIFKYLKKQTLFQKKLLEEDKDIEDLDYKNVYAYIRNIKSFEDSNFKTNFQDEDLTKVADFKKEIKESIDDENVLEIDVDLKNILKTQNGSLNYSYDELAKFKEQMIEYLKKSIDSYKNSIKYLPDDEIEKLEQERFKNSKLKGFLGRKEALECIENYLNSDNKEALVIYGKSGLGKSSVIAKAINNAENRYKNKKIIYKFVASTPKLTTSVDILISILKELGIKEEIRKVPNPQTLQIENEKLEEFYYRVYDYLNFIKEETIIFIDAVDQLINEDDFLWLPKTLVANLKIVISVLKDENYEEDSKYFALLQNKTENIYELEPFSEPQAKELTLNLLKEYNRTITDEQMQYLLDISKDIQTVLYYVVAVQELRYLKSHQTLTLEATQQDIIKEFKENLSKLYHHDKEFINIVFGYLYLTNGLSQSEILELLSSDIKFVETVASETYHENSTKELPTVIWARFYSHIKEFLKEENIDGQTVLKFFHREFEDIAKDILTTEEQKHLVNLLKDLMIKYQNEDFNSNRWAKLYIEVVQKYHLAYEFDYLPNENSKLAIWSKALAHNIKNKEYLEKFILSLNKLGLEYLETNKTKLAFYFNKSYFYIAKELYEKNQSFWVEDYTTSLNNLAYSLSLIGKTDEAIELDNEALAIRKVQYKENPPRWAEDYTRSLNNLASSLISIGETAEAIELENEALAIINVHFKENPSFWTEAYAISLNILASSLSSIGETAEAIELFKEALDIRKEQYKEDPSFLAKDYTRSLNNLALSLSSIGETAEAIELFEEALAILKEQYIKNPNRWAKLYTTSLNNLAASLSSIGKTDEAIKLQNETVDILKKYHKENPSFWAELYTTSLNILASSLKLVGKTTKAIELQKEAVDILKVHYKENPSKWVEDYTTSLNNLALSLSSVGKTDEAIEILKEAVDILKVHYKENPSFWADYYTTSLNNLASSFYKIEKTAEAIEILKEKVVILREHHKKEPSKWAENYIDSLNNLASSFYKIGKTAKAIELLNEAVDILKVHYKEDPNRWAELYRRSLNNLASSLDSIGKTDESIEHQKETLDIREELYKEDSSKFEEGYTTKLNNLMVLLDSMGKTDESIEHQKEALDILKELYKENPSRWAELYTTSLNNLASYLDSDGKTDEAIELYKETLDILKVLYKGDPSRWAELYTTSLNNLAYSLSSIGQTAETIKFYKEALAILKELYKENPSFWAEDYTRILNSLATSFYNTGKIYEAMELGKEALDIIKDLYKKDSSFWEEAYTLSLYNLGSSYVKIYKWSEASEKFNEYFDKKTFGKDVEISYFIYPFVKWYECALNLKDNNLKLKLDKIKDEQIKAYKNYLSKDEYKDDIFSVYEEYKDLRESKNKSDIERYDIFVEIFYNEYN